ALDAPTLDEPRPAEEAQDRGWPWRRQRKQPSPAPAPEPDEALEPPELVEPVPPPAPAPVPAAPQPTFPNLARPAASVTGSKDLLTAPLPPKESSIEIPAPSPDRQGEPASAPQVASARPTPPPVAQPRFVGWVERPGGGHGRLARSARRSARRALRDRRRDRRDASALAEGIARRRAKVRSAVDLRRRLPRATAGLGGRDRRPSAPRDPGRFGSADPG